VIAIKEGLMSQQMISNSFTAFNESELNILQRIFREAKFCREPDDLEITDSPDVAELYEDLIEALIEHDNLKYGKDQVERWRTWLADMDETRDEWAATLTRLASNPKWLTLTKSAQSELVRTMFRPFSLSEEKLPYFISQVNQQAHLK
jgi:tRNA-dihydrouridine synthase